MMFGDTLSRVGIGVLCSYWNAQVESSSLGDANVLRQIALIIQGLASVGP